MLTVDTDNKSLGVYLQEYGNIRWNDGFLLGFICGSLTTATIFLIRT